MLYHITAQHTRGKSVAHCCVNGIYDDPANVLDEVIEAGDVDEAEAIGWDKLCILCDDATVCQCRRRLSPGGESWHQSVILNIIQQD